MVLQSMKLGSQPYVCKRTAAVVTNVYWKRDYFKFVVALHNSPYMERRQHQWYFPLKVLDLNSKQIHLNLTCAAACHFRQTLTDLINQHTRTPFRQLTTKEKVYGQINGCTINPLFAFILCSSSFIFKYITVINRKCSPPKIKTTKHIAVKLSQAVIVFTFFTCHCRSTPLSPHSYYTNYLCHPESKSFLLASELCLSACEHIFRSVTSGPRSKVCHLRHVFVCVISYLLLSCCCRHWTVAPLARQVVWKRPSPAVAPTLCPGGWLTCSPFVCPRQYHCVLYLKASIERVKLMLLLP